MKSIIFDIGANDGKTFLQNAANGDFVYAFEPTPKLINDIKSWLNPTYPNYILVEKAVSITDGKATFYVAGQNDWGTSSLLEFSDHINETWPNRPDLKVTEKIEVETTRLDTFINENKISKIDYLHIDTQGTDLNVLKSLGKYITIVNGGCVEVPQSKRVELYKGNHDRQETIDFLDSNGFKITRISSQMNEDNLFFERK